MAQVNYAALSSAFRKMLAGVSGKTEALNAGWKAVIGEAVKKAYSDKDGSQYVQAAVDSASFDVRPAVVSALRTFGIQIDRLEGHKRQFSVPELCVRDKKKQEAMIAKVKAGDIPDVVGKADPIPKPAKAKELAGKPAERAQKIIDRALKALSDDPEARAILNDRLTAVADAEKTYSAGVAKGEKEALEKSSGCLILEDGSGALRLDAEEYDAVLEFIMEQRTGVALAA